MKASINLLFLAVLIFGVYCDSPTSSNSNIEVELGDEADLTIPDWTTESHSNDVDPIYSVVFQENTIKRLDIEISETNWQAMQSDLSKNLTTGGFGQADVDFDPIWVPATLTFQGQDWYKVGIRYKGNSTLRNAYSSSTDKYPFKLDFDEFEDDFPVINNQRFFGFKQLNLSNNDADGTFLREKISADLFREFGVPSARTAFYAIYLNRGNGTQFIGIYTLVEEVDDSMPDSQFDDNDGNLYKPDGDAATFASGTFDEDELDLKTNEDEADFSDVQTFYDVLHSDLRSNNPESWKTDLENIFNVDGFLKYLAVNNVIQNWDTYGNMTHNYFLYNDSGILNWIPWDNNEAFQEGKMSGSVSLGMNEVSTNWPIIRYIMDVEEYATNYQSYIDEFTNGPFETTSLNNQITDYQNLIEEFASQENSSFASNISSLQSYVLSRNATAKSFVN